MYVPRRKEAMKQHFIVTRSVGFNVYALANKYISFLELTQKGSLAANMDSIVCVWALSRACVKKERESEREYFMRCTHTHKKHAI